MKREWDTNDLIDNFTLTTEEKQWLAGKSPYNQLGRAVLLKFFQYEGRFPERLRDIPTPVREYIAQQLDSSATLLEQYDWMGRTMRDDRAAIRARLGYRESTQRDFDALQSWLSSHPILYEDHRHTTLQDILYERLQTLQLEPPTA